MGKQKMQDVYSATITGRGLKSLADTFKRAQYNVSTTTDKDGKITQLTVTDYTTDMAQEVVGLFGIKRKIMSRTLTLGPRRRVPV